MDTKSPAAARKNWEDAIGRVPSKYKEGVSGASNVIEKSKAAEDLWKSAITEAAAREARKKGLNNVSDAEWKKASTDKGANRIASGMEASKDKFGSGISEVISKLQSITLPARTTDVRQNVNNRVGLIAEELHKMKTE